jgi:hypothetical protein
MLLHHASTFVQPSLKEINPQCIPHNGTGTFMMDGEDLEMH